MDRRKTVIAVSASFAFFAFFAFFALSALPARALLGLESIVASGKVVTESRTASGYTGIGLAVPGTLVVRQGGTESVSIEADDNLMPEIDAVVERGILRIRFKRKLNVSGRSTIRILVSGPTFDSLSVAGSGDIVSEAIKSRSLALSVAGSGDVRIAKVDAESLAVSVAGSGDVGVAGRASELSAKVAGAGDIDAGRLESQRVKLSIAGSGDAKVWARESLEVSIAGSGDVRYYGDPKVTKRVAGAGSIKGLGAAP